MTDNVIINSSAFLASGIVASLSYRVFARTPRRFLPAHEQAARYILASSFVSIACDVLPFPAEWRELDMVAMILPMATGALLGMIGAWLSWLISPTSITDDSASKKDDQQTKAKTWFNENIKYFFKGIVVSPEWLTFMRRTQGRMFHDISYTNGTIRGYITEWPFSDDDCYRVTEYSNGQPGSEVLLPRRTVTSIKSVDPKEVYNAKERTGSG